MNGMELGLALGLEDCVVLCNILLMRTASMGDEAGCRSGSYSLLVLYRLK